ncbi:hypothetical protein N431DRAFT_427564 [Stipitochalara longipes BDJ]|nr:hypothetical protein N431DRAFT_427564 [Stipitochalara longipes BDJ]
MINILLRYGANPNQLWHGNSPWQYTLTYVHQKCLPYKAALLTVMLMHGANPFSTCRQNHTVAGYLALSQHHPAHSVQAIVEDISSSLGSSEALDLRHVLQYYMSLWQACPGTKKCKDDDLERRPQRKSSRR